MSRFSVATIEGMASSNLGTSLQDMLMCDEIVPGSDPSYSVCKTILLYHPLGAKMAEAPIKMAQSQPRTITVQDAPKEVVEEFLRVETELKCPRHILNYRRLSRVYGMSSMVLGCVGKPASEPLDMTKLWQLPIFFNVFDPLNMSGSMIANQVPNTPEFNQATRVVCNGQTYHRSRSQIAMNEEPVYIAYTSAAFGFTGRSVYQRALFPLKSFVQTMIADDMIARKLGLIVAHMKSPGGVVSRAMQAIAALKRRILGQGGTNQVATIDLEEKLETLDMQNVDGAGSYSRDNILKNVATAADMPAKLLQNETMIGGMAEGTEDAKVIANYIESVRLEMKPDYDWTDNIVRYRAWMNPAFYERIKTLYPKELAGKTHEALFTEWCRSFNATWPSMLTEPDSEKAKMSEVKVAGNIDIVDLLFDKLDSENQAVIIEAALDNISEEKNLFPNGFELDPDTLRAHLAEQAKRTDELHDNTINPPDTDDTEDRPKGLGRLDSVRGSGVPRRLRAAIARRISAVPA